MPVARPITMPVARPITMSVARPITVVGPIFHQPAIDDTTYTSRDAPLYTNPEPAIASRPINTQNLERTPPLNFQMNNNEINAQSNFSNIETEVLQNVEEPPPPYIDILNENKTERIELSTLTTNTTAVASSTTVTNNLCSNCGSQLVYKAKFCYNCGNSIL